MRWALTIFTILISAAPLSAKKPQYTDYDARLVSIYDGDTLRADIHIFPAITWHASIRVRGVDTPELRSKCAAEKRAARAARDYVRALIPKGAAIRLLNVKRGKYAGRVVATVMIKQGRRWVDLAGVLISTRHGRPYHGGKRRGWC